MIKFAIDIEACASLLKSPSDDFAELSRLSGLDPASDFINADLSGIDFGSDDLTGFNFQGADLRGTNLSRTTGVAKSALQGTLKNEDTKMPLDFWTSRLERARRLKRMAVKCRKNKKYQEAIDYLFEALRIETDLYGNQQPHLKSVLHRIANVYREIKDYDKAILYYNQLIEIAEVHSQSNNVLSVLLSIAEINLERGNASNANLFVRDIEILMEAGSKFSPSDYLKFLYFKLTLARISGRGTFIVSALRALVSYYDENNNLKYLSKTLIDLGTFFYNESDIEQAEATFFDVMYLHKKTDIQDSDLYAEAIAKLWAIASLKQNGEKMYEIIQEVLRLMDFNYSFEGLSKAQAQAVFVGLAQADGNFFRQLSDKDSMSFVKLRK